MAPRKDPLEIAEEIDRELERRGLDVRFVLMDGCFYVRAADKGLFTCQRAGLTTYVDCLRKEGYYDVFLRRLDDQGRKHHRLWASFTPGNVGPHDHNVLSRDGWVIPDLDADGHHWAFDALMEALSGGRAENREHIEKVLVRKYLHPEDHLIPALVIFGNGNVGKSLFVDAVLATIFGEAQVVSLKAEEAFGKHNSMLQWRTAVLIDEAVRDRADMALLKRMIHNRKLEINKKHVAQHQVENTALWLIASNDRDGAITLAGDDSDRRWSLIRVRRTLKAIVAEHLTRLRGVAVDAGEADVWIKEQPVWTDRAEIARWLGVLVRRWRAEAERPILALHGEDHAEVMDRQAGTLRRLLERVFTHPEFHFVSLRNLYDMYKMFDGEENPSGHLMKKARVRSAAEEYLERAGLPIVYKEQTNIVLTDEPDASGEPRRTTRPGFADMRVAGRVPVPRSDWWGPSLDELRPPCAAPSGAEPVDRLRLLFMREEAA